MDVTTRKRRLLVLVLASLAAVAVGASLVLWNRARQPWHHRQGVSYGVAEAYLAAVMDGDKEASLSLYHGDSWCSAPFPYPSDRMDEHIAMLASAEVRDVTIVVEPADGTPYTPGSERAEISFKYRTDGIVWRSGTIWLVLGPLGSDGKRFICHLA